MTGRQFEFECSYIGSGRVIIGLEFGPLNIMYRDVYIIRRACKMQISNRSLLRWLVWFRCVCGERDVRPSIQYTIDLVCASVCVCVLCGSGLIEDNILSTWRACQIVCVSVCPCTCLLIDTDIQHVL